MTETFLDRLHKSLGEGYAIERELGGGGMSRVFLAQDRSLGRPVVIKVLTPDLASGVNPDRFRREIQVAAQLQHPHIVPVLAAGEVDGLPWFIMPYVSGQALRQKLDGTRGLPVHEAIGILRDIAKALAHAHAQGIVHRDIKPENVLIAGGSAAVTDFGIAKALSTSRAAGDPNLTLGGTSLGTPAYMAPEQAAADPATDHRADIYSFGVLAFELMAGRPPFHGRPPQALLAAHMAELPPPVESVAPHTPPSLAALIARCLAKIPAERPPNAAALLDALDRIETSGSHRTVPVSAVPLRSRRRWLTTGVAAGGLLLVAALAGWAMLGSGNARTDQQLVAVAPFRVATADPSLHYLRDGMLDLLAAKLTGEGGLRATEPRVVLAEWNRSGGSSSTDLAPEASLEMAQRLSAGRLLLGDVVGTPTNLVLSVSLLSVPDGRTLARHSVEGPPDSLARLVDQVAARLLATVSGEGEERLGRLTSASLPALRAYLDGNARLRRGQAAQAMRDFQRALDHDSTFALAGLALRVAAAWSGPVNGPDAVRGLQVAYAQRNQLSPRDRALFEALAGPRFPAPSSTAEQFEARRRYRDLAPDRADAWVLYADDLFHFGSILGIADPTASSLQAFQRALDLDSTNALAFSHMLALAVMEEDTTLERRLLRISGTLPDSVTEPWLKPYRWYRARKSDDSAAVRAYRDSVTPEDQSLLYYFMHVAELEGTGIDDAWYALQSLILRGSDADQRAGYYNLARTVALQRGRPRAALAYLERISEPDGFNANISRVRDAMMADGDTAAAREAARKLAVLEQGPIPPDTAGWRRQRGVIRAMEPWRLSRGDTSRTAASLERLRALEQRLGSSTETQTEIAVIEAMYSHLLRRPDARRRVERLDSLLAAGEYIGVHSGRMAMYAIVTGLIFESLGDTDRAYAAARRRAIWWNTDQVYLATQLREEGRLAALAGNRDAAIRAYRHYLTLRTDPDPALRPEADRIRAELARLLETDVRR